ncbi:MAG: hypothetical protein A2162_07280 [Deltaproteobacteria bacterium RBG_13_52_11b]|nr:MAG: hypothetical protein A2162_07280 [Deltaproteobacteria bacterium RBG_13_52_11b]
MLLKRANRAKVRKGRKKGKSTRRARPRNVWNSLRRLENYLRKADLQADIFMDSLNELRDVMAFEIKTEFIKKLCNSVHGDLLGALWNQQKKVEEKQVTDRENEEVVAILCGVFEVLVKYFDLRPYKFQGERLFVSRESARNFDFDEVPENLDDEKVQKVEVEVLRCGWKIGDKVIQKPKVFGVSSSEAGVGPGSQCHHV